MMIASPVMLVSERVILIQTVSPAATLSRLLSVTTVDVRPLAVLLTVVVVFVEDANALVSTDCASAGVIAATEPFQVTLPLVLPLRDIQCSVSDQLPVP